MHTSNEVEENPARLEKRERERKWTVRASMSRLAAIQAEIVPGIPTVAVLKVQVVASADGTRGGGARSLAGWRARRPQTVFYDVALLRNLRVYLRFSEPARLIIFLKTDRAIAAQTVYGSRTRRSCGSALSAL